MDKKHTLNEIALYKFIEKIPRLDQIKYYNVFDNYWRVDLWVRIDSEFIKEQFGIGKSYFIKIDNNKIIDCTLRKNNEEKNDKLS